MITSYSFLRIAGLCADESACGYYRVINPLTEFRKLGAYTEVFTTIAPNNLKDFDIIIAQRQVSPGIYSMLSSAIDAGKTVIFEIDDLMDKIDPNAPAFEYYHTGTADLKGLKSIMALSHGITVTTPELAGDALGYSKNVKILPNMIDFTLRDWPVKKFNDTNELVIGWTGSHSHIVDLPLLGSVLEIILRKYKHVRYAHYASAQLAELLIANYNLPTDRIDLVDIRPFKDYPPGLVSFDIGLAPVNNTAFNRAKSPLKAMEYNAAGIPFVASKVAPYQRYVNEGGLGYTAATLTEWVDTLSNLIEDTSLRRDLGETALDYTRENHALARNIDQWYNAWTDISFSANVAGVGPGKKVSLEPKRNEACLCGSGAKYKRCGCFPAFGGG